MTISRSRSKLLSNFSINPLRSDNYPRKRNGMLGRGLFGRSLNITTIALGGTETIINGYAGTNETWKIHTFTSGTSTFILNQHNTLFPIRILIVGGGGSSPNTSQVASDGGGGAGGGYIFGTLPLLGVGEYSVVVGIGGSGGVTNGSSSSFGPYTAVGGGTSTGNSGGSLGASNNGGVTTLTANGAFGGGGYGGQIGGGGGAGSTGGGAGGGFGGGGGPGGPGLTNNYRLGTNEVYGAGGSGGWNTGGPPGAANTGNGGTGAYNGSGGSGIVVVAYRIA